MLADLSIQGFLEKTASSSPVPGGGSVAALSACLAASLTEMVANLTIGKKGYETVQDDMQTIAADAFRLRHKLTQAIDKDADAYREVMSALKLPRGTDKEKHQREKALQDGFKQAALIPMGVAADAAKVMQLAGQAVVKGNKNTITDGAVGVMMARTAVLAALYNARINLSSIKDSAFVDEISKHTNDLEMLALRREKELLSPIDL